MNNKMIVVITSLICLFALTACGNSVFHPVNFKNLTPEKRCALIKRQIVYNRNNRNVEAKWLARSQKQDLENLFDANNCDRVLNKN